MTAVGIDTHKDSLAACVVDELGAPLAERTFANDPAAHEALWSWVTAAAPGATIGIEGSSRYGAAAARFLLAHGATVREVPPQLTYRERGRTRLPGKSDPGDALAIARVTAREQALPPVRLADRTVEIGLLAQAREDAVTEAVRVRNRLHADLVIVVPSSPARTGAWRGSCSGAGWASRSSLPGRGWLDWRPSIERPERTRSGLASLSAPTRCSRCMASGC